LADPHSYLPEPATPAGNGDTPLLETGEMRDSIEHSSNSSEALVGSNSDKAVWHELGTIHIPPRSFLALAAAEKGRAAAAAAGRIIGNYLAEGAEFGSVLHEIRKAAHEIKDLAEETLDLGDDKKGE
jgi:hypothetical protein